MIGVKITGYDEEPNDIWGTPYVIATDHFVIAVGNGRRGRTTSPTSTSMTISMHTTIHDRLYLTPLVILESEKIEYI